MPELPEVETVRRGLAAAMEGRPIARVRLNRADLRIPFPDGFADALGGRTVTQVGRRAKYLVIRLDDGTVLLAHLGMSGRMLIDGPESAEADGATGRHRAHEHVVFEIGNGTFIRFCDPRRFGLMTLTREAELATHPLIAHLGPEPTGADFTGPVLAGLIAGKRTPIKAALLDQRVVAGLGNIYVCESLFMAGISPRRIAATVQGKRADRLARAIREVLAAAIEAGGSTLRDHVAPSGEMGYFQHAFKVYGRAGEPCPGCDCDDAIRRITQSGRSTFYCATRQR
jgi:formamidopyrimidine-DNA glycosylase